MALIGEGNIPLLGANGSSSTTDVTWAPPVADTYTIYAVIDPDLQVTEQDESNNAVQRSVVVLPASPDQLAPSVDTFVINDGSLLTGERNVSLFVTASDAGLAEAVGTEIASGVSGIFFVEYHYNNTIKTWVPVQTSAGWLGYPSAAGGYPWQLTSDVGMKYIQAWAVDQTGNMSAMPRRAYVNYTPSTQVLAAGQARIHRFTLSAGDQLLVRVAPISGDPDIYLWAPDYETRLPWYSNLGAGQLDELNVTAPVDGVYQLEVFGYSATEYLMTIKVTSAVNAAAMPDSATGIDPNKSAPVAPITPIDQEPETVYGLTPPQTHLYLPVIQR